MVSRKTVSGIRENVFFIHGKRFDELTDDESYSSATSYLGICIILSFLLMSLSLFYFYFILDGAQMMISLNYALFDSAFNVILMLIGFLVFQVTLSHISSKVFGAKKNLLKTFQVNTYAYTPYFLLGWIWLLGSNNSSFELMLLALGVIFSLIATVNVISGLRHVHKLSFLKSVIAGFLVPLLAYFVFILVFEFGSEFGLS